MRMYEIEMVGKKLNIGQEYEFFQNQGPKEDALPVGPKEEAEGVGTALALVVSICPCVTLGRSQGSPSALVWGWELSLVSGRWRLGRKEPSGYLHRTGPLVAAGGLPYRELGVEMSKIKCVEEKSQQFPPFPPQNPNFLKCTHILLSNVEKSHSGCAYKKIVVKKLCLYDNIPTISKKRGQKSECVRQQISFPQSGFSLGLLGLGTRTYLERWLGDT